MVRKILGILIGAVILIVISLMAGGAATAMFHLDGMGSADIDHPHAALAMGGILILSLGTLLGGTASAYAGVRIGHWVGCAWIIAVIGAFDAFSAAQLFANFVAVFVPTVVMMTIGCWLGVGLSRLSGAPLPA